MSDTILPEHIGIIMDGNGRWAKKRGLPRNAGHKAGADTFKKIVRYANKIGIKYMTVYAFSTENWKRPDDEIAGIMDLLRRFLKDAVKSKDENVRTIFIGDRSALDEDIKVQMAECEQASASHDGLTLNIAVNYGGKSELVHAAQEIAALAAQGKLLPDEIDEQTIDEHLYTAGQPPVDLIIRPSGEQRLSNFLPWQAAYAEYIFMDVLWPDFSEASFDEALELYQNRNRRFGGI